MITYEYHDNGARDRNVHLMLVDGDEVCVYCELTGNNAACAWCDGRMHMSCDADLDEDWWTCQGCQEGDD